MGFKKVLAYTFRQGDFLFYVCGDYHFGYNQTSVSGCDIDGDAPFWEKWQKDEFQKRQSGKRILPPRNRNIDIGGLNLKPLKPAIS